MQKMNWLQRLADRADLLGESLPGVPLLEIAGDCRVLIEEHKGVTEYSKEQICIKVSYGLVCICGCGLELIKMSREQLAISGRIDCVKLQRKGC